MLHDKATARSLGMLRIWVFGLGAIMLHLSPVTEVYLVPDYQPPGIMRLIGASFWKPLLTLPVLQGIQIVSTGLMLLVAAGVGPYRLMAVLACLAMTLNEGLVRGASVTTHANLVLILCAYVLAMFPAADALTLFRRKHRPPMPAPEVYQAAMMTLSLVFCTTYVFVAARRLSASGIDIYLDDSILSAIALRDAELGEAGGWGKWACESFLVGWSMKLGFPVVTLL